MQTRLPSQATDAAFDSIVYGRRSVRTFAVTPVTRNTIEEILELARWAPSPHNAQPWRFAVLLNDETKKDLAMAMGQRWQQDLQADGAPARVVDIRTTQSYKRLTGAPAIIIASVCMEDMDRYPDPFRQSVERTLATQCVGAFVQTLLLAAESRGLGAVWMCAPAFCPDTVQMALRLPPGWEPQAMVLVGYPGEDPSPPARMEIAEFVVYR